MFSPLLRRWITFSIPAIILTLTLYSLVEKHNQPSRRDPIDHVLHPGFFRPKFQWKQLPQKYPVKSFAKLPTGHNVAVPEIQHRFEPESPGEAIERRRRLKAVEKAFVHSWEGYKKNAWLQDEVSPLSGSARNPFGGWGATLVDTLDTLWIMGLKKEFKVALAALKRIDFTSSSSDELNVFETTIRYLGGLLSAYDVSGQQHNILLQKAVELGEMLYAAFDTPNRMPVTRWDWRNAALGNEQHGDRFALLAEVGSLTLEFTRLSQLTGDPKFYDAVARVTDVFEDSQNRTKLPGLWPVFVDAKNADFTRDSRFTFGGMSDSLYEYLPKQHLMLGGQTDQYRNMFLTALESAKEHIFFRPMNPSNSKLLLPGLAERASKVRMRYEPQSEHLGCFAGGMVALAAKAFRQTNDLETARELVDGCLWAYESMPSGIMPEVFHALPCNSENCTWNEEAWLHAVAGKDDKGSPPERYVQKAQSVIEERKLAPGFVNIDDARYILRPEAIESLFVLYRITGDTSLQDKAWAMFQSISNATKTSIAYAAVKDVTEAEPQHLDSMESFWTAETLKYFYLIFSEPDVISLDQYVLNTEAHPLLRPA